MGVERGSSQDHLISNLVHDFALDVQCSGSPGLAANGGLPSSRPASRRPLPAAYEKVAPSARVKKRHGRPFAPLPNEGALHLLFKCPWRSIGEACTAPLVILCVVRCRSQRAAPPPTTAAFFLLYSSAPNDKRLTNGAGCISLDVMPWAQRRRLVHYSRHRPVSFMVKGRLCYARRPAC